MNDRRTEVFIAGGGGDRGATGSPGLAGDLVHVTLASPAPEFIYKPLTVEEPFSPEPATRLDSNPRRGDRGTFVQKGVRAIDADRRIAELDDGATLDFDAAIVCIGAQPRGAFAGAETLRTSGEPIDIDALLRRASEHEFGRMAFIVPPTGSWPLPVYELALMAQRRARELPRRTDHDRHPRARAAERLRAACQRCCLVAARHSRSRFARASAPARGPTARSCSILGASGSTPGPRSRFPAPWSRPRRPPR